MARRNDREGQNAYKRGWYAKNREKALRQRNRWAQTNPEKRKASLRNYSLKTKFGITSAQWDAMFEKQGRACGICRSAEPRGGRWATDHDHLSGKLRGILCFRCNVGIGNFFDEIRLLEKAIGYLSWFEAAK